VVGVQAPEQAPSTHRFGHAEPVSCQWPASLQFWGCIPRQRLADALHSEAPPAPPGPPVPPEPPPPPVARVPPLPAVELPPVPGTLPPEPPLELPPVAPPVTPPELTLEPP